MRKHWPDTDGGHGRWALGQAHLHRQGPGGTKEHASLREVQTVWRCSSRELGEQRKMELGGGRQGLGHPKFANYAESWKMRNTDRFGCHLRILSEDNEERGLKGEPEDREAI